MWRISPGGAEAWLAAHGGAAELTATSPAIREALLGKVKAPFGQQTQSKHSVPHAVDGSSHPTGQSPEMPDTAALKPTSTRMAPRANADRFTRGGFISPPGRSRITDVGTVWSICSQWPGMCPSSLFAGDLAVPRTP
jgi:hypothetical protein